MNEIEPPKMTPIPSGVIMDRSIPAPILQTYERINALAWRHDYKYTDWLSMDEMMHVFGDDRKKGGRINRSTVIDHIGKLKVLKLITWTTDGKDRYRFFILEVRLEQVGKSYFSDPSSGSGINSINDSDLQLLPPTKSEKSDLDLTLDRDAYEALRAIGIGKKTSAKLSNMPHVTAAYVRAMVTQAKRDGVGPGALIYRINDGWCPPMWCEQCGGLDGEHADVCPTQAEKRARDDARRESQAALVQQASPQDDENMRIWRLTLEQLQLQLTGATFDTWLRRTSLIGEQDGMFVIAVHNGYAKDWLENRLTSMVKRTLIGIVGRSVEVRFVVSELAQALPIPARVPAHHLAGGQV